MRVGCSHGLFKQTRNHSSVQDSLHAASGSLRRVKFLTLIWESWPGNGKLRSEGALAFSGKREKMAPPSGKIRELKGKRKSSKRQQEPDKPERETLIHKERARHARFMVLRRSDTVFANKHHAVSQPAQEATPHAGRRLTHDLSHRGFQSVGWNKMRRRNLNISCRPAWKSLPLYAVCASSPFPARRGLPLLMLVASVRRKYINITAPRLCSARGGERNVDAKDSWRRGGGV